MRMWTRSVINSGTTMSVTMTPVSGREKKEVQYWNAISIKRWTIAVTYRSRMAARFCCFFCCNSRSWRRRRIANPKPRIRWTKLKVLLRSHLSDRTTGCHPGWYTSACSSQSTSPAGEKEMKLEAWRTAHNRNCENVSPSLKEKLLFTSAFRLKFWAQLLDASKRAF